MKFPLFTSPLAETHHMYSPHSLFSRHANIPKANSSSLILPLFNQIQTQTPSPECHYDRATALATQLESCTDPSELAPIHAHVLRRHLLLAPFHWNALMRSYLRHSRPLHTLLIFVQMSSSGATPDSYSFPIALKAASQTFSLSAGRQLHSAAIKLGLEFNEFCESGLINIYAKTGEFDSALNMFDQNPQRKLGSWNAIISGLAQGGHLAEAIEMFIKLRRAGLVPDDVTMVSVASACGGLGDLNLAQQVHKCVLQAQNLGRLDVMVCNSLVDMYSKCGRTDLAYQVFRRVTQKNVATWTAMITGLATHGKVGPALELFKEMREEGVTPNHVTMVGVLCACAHGGRIEEGMRYLNGMAREWGVEPTVAHYGCAADMLGKVGRLAEARAVVENMPVAANAVVWGTLLGASEKHGDVEVGEWAAGKLLELEPWNDGVYVVLSNIYAGKGMWEEVERLRRLMRERRVAKTPGYSLAAMSA